MNNIIYTTSSKIIKTLYKQTIFSLGSSSTYLTQVSYVNYRSKLVTYARSATDTAALASLPIQTTEPATGTAKTNIWISFANARAIGFTTSSVPQDSTIQFYADSCNLDRVTVSPSK